MSRLDELKELRARIDEEISLEIRRERAVGTINRGGRRRRKGLEHGTDSGYYWHLRHGIAFPEDDGGESCGCRARHALEENHRILARARAARTAVTA